MILAGIPSWLSFSEYGLCLQWDESSYVPGKLGVIDRYSRPWGASLWRRWEWGLSSSVFCLFSLFCLFRVVKERKKKQIFSSEHDDLSLLENITSNFAVMWLLSVSTAHPISKTGKQEPCWLTSLDGHKHNAFLTSPLASPSLVPRLLRVSALRLQC